LNTVKIPIPEIIKISLVKCFVIMVGKLNCISVVKCKSKLSNQFNDLISTFIFYRILCLTIEMVKNIEYIKQPTTYVMG